MDDFEYTPDEKMLEERRQKRIAMKRKQHKRKQITALAIILIILAVIIALVINACSGDKEPAVEETPVVEEVVVEEEPVMESSPDVTVTLAAVGDIMTYQEQIDDSLMEDGTYDFLPAFSQVADYLANADITVGNLETNFAGFPYAGYPTFSAPESLATTLSAIGFDVLQTANTYSIQNGITGMTSTINTVRGANMDTLGTYIDTADRAENQVSVQEVNGVKFAFIGMTKGLNNMTLPTESSTAVDLLFNDYYTNYSNIDTAEISALVSAAKATEADVIVAMLHWGNEYDATVGSTQDAIADLMFQAGVDVILGSHPHVVAPMETRTVTVDGESREVFIAYSLGNFYSSMTKDNTQEGMILNLEFTKNGTTGDTTITDISYVSTYVIDNGETAADRYTIRSIDRALEEGVDDTLTASLTAAKSNIQTMTGYAAD
ncbi:MAG: CapA family protein [Eubacteriales bacterium]